MLLTGQEEPRTSELGHTISFAADRLVRFADDYYSSDRVFDRIHELGGVTGYAHQGMLFHGYRGMTPDVLAGKLDFLAVGGAKPLPHGSGGKAAVAGATLIFSL